MGEMSATLIKANDYKQAMIAFVNVALVEDTFTNINNTYRDFLDAVSVAGVRPGVYPKVMIASVPTADMISAYGDNLSADDLVISLTFDQGSPLQELRGDDLVAYFSGLLVEATMMSFTQLSPFTMAIKHYRDISPSGLEPSITRNITVTPTGGVDTPFQFVVFPIGVNQDLTEQSTITAGGLVVPAWTDQTRGQFSYITPTPLKKSQSLPSAYGGWYASIIVVFKGLGVYPQSKVQIKATPMFAHIQTRELLEEMLETTGSAFNAQGNG